MSPAKTQDLGQGCTHGSSDTLRLKASAPVVRVQVLCAVSLGAFSPGTYLS